MLKNSVFISHVPEKSLGHSFRTAQLLFSLLSWACRYQGESRWVSEQPFSVQSASAAQFTSSGRKILAEFSTTLYWHWPDDAGNSHVYYRKQYRFSLLCAPTTSRISINYPVFYCRIYFPKFLLIPILCSSVSLKIWNRLYSVLVPFFHVILIRLDCLRR